MPPHPARIASYAERIAKLTSEILPANSESQTSSRIMIYEGTAWKLVGGALETYEKLVKDLFEKENFGSKYSISFIEELINSAVKKYLDSQNLEEITQLVNSFFIDFESFSEFRTVSIPLFGIIPESDKFTLSDIDFIRYTEDFISDKISKINQIFSQTLNTEEAQYLTG